MLLNIISLDRPFIAVMFVLFASLVLVDAAMAEMRIFQLQHQSAQELAEIVRSLVGENVKIASHKNSLVVDAGPSVLADVAKVVASYDRPLSMLRVTVEQTSLSKGEKQDMSVSGLYEDDSIIVGLGRPEHKGNSSIRIQDDSRRLHIGADDKRREESRAVKQFLTIVEGSPARISVGRAVPLTAEMRTYCQHHPVFIETVEYHHVDTGFEVLPELFENVVELEVRPFMSFMDQKRPNQIVFQELTTKVRIPLGAWYELGGYLKKQDGLSREIMATGSRSRQDDGSIRIRVDHL